MRHARLIWYRLTATVANWRYRKTLQAWMARPSRDGAAKVKAATVRSSAMTTRLERLEKQLRRRG